MIEDARAPLRHPLLHRWFVQYNPVYLLSAALVLVGVHLLYRDLMAAGFLYGQLGVPAIAEIYAWALVGGAALLTRIGMRRPGVLLALLAVFYQGDITLLAETSVYLGAAGAAAAALWLASFAAKLAGLAWALRLRLSRSAIAVALLGGLGIVVVPRTFSGLGPEGASVVLAAWWFTVAAAGLWSCRQVRSVVPLDAWGHTVLRRALAATWATWTALAAMHVAFWSTDHRVSCDPLLFAGLLLATRAMARERHVWTTVGVTVVGAVVLLPSATWLIAALAAATLGLHALRRPAPAPEPSPEPTPNAGPYRQPDSEPAAANDRDHEAVPGFALAPVAARRRLLTGTMFATYFAAWTFGWPGGAWPDHSLLLDAQLTVIALGAFFAYRAKEPLVPLAPVHLHHAVALGWIAAPSSRLEWGLIAVSAGFGSLFVSLAVSYWLTRLRLHDERAVRAAPAAER